MESCLFPTLFWCNGPPKSTSLTPVPCSRQQVLSSAQTMPQQGTLASRTSLFAIFEDSSLAPVLRVC
jgi:hypothetical protein